MEDSVESGALNLNSAAGNKDRDIFAAVMQGAEVIPAQAKIQVQSPSYLPCVGTKKIQSVYHDLAFRIAQR